MDAVSYSHADKQKQRIEKINANPDSTSGLVTMPSTIAVGETVTIPAGRVVVHPNLQVDGTLDIQGDLFIPSGGTSDQLVNKSGDTMTGNLNFTNSGAVFSGDTSGSWVDGSIGNHNVVGTTIRGKAGTVFDLALYNAGGTKALLTHSVSNSNVVVAEKLTIDTAGNVLVTGSGGLGYGTGSGGIVTQLTSKGTLVTLDKPCGMITMNNASLAGGAIAQFQVNNSRCGAYDKVDVWVMGGTGSLQQYDTWASPFNTNGAFYVEVKNITGGALSEAVQIGFSITKGAIA